MWRICSIRSRSRSRSCSSEEEGRDSSGMFPSSLELELDNAINNGCRTDGVFMSRLSLSSIVADVAVGGFIFGALYCWL